MICFVRVWSLLSYVTVAVEIALVRFYLFWFSRRKYNQKVSQRCMYKCFNNCFLPSCKLWAQFIAFCSAIRLKLHVHLILFKRKPIRWTQIFFIFLGVTCPWGQMSFGSNVLWVKCHLGSNVLGVKCPWGQMSLGSNNLVVKCHRGQMSFGVKCPWGHMSLESNVLGVKCSWGQMSLGSNVLGVKCPWDEIPLGSNVFGVKRLWYQLSRDQMRSTKI